jgi:hypothetical protein
MPEQPCQCLNIGVSYFICCETWMSSIQARCTTSQITAFTVIVDAIDDQAQAFYRHHSFLPLPDSPYRLFRRLSEIAALFETG